MCRKPFIETHDKSQTRTCNHSYLHGVGVVEETVWMPRQGKDIWLQVDDIKDLGRLGAMNVICQFDVFTSVQVLAEYTCIVPVYFGKARDQQTPLTDPGSH